MTSTEPNPISVTLSVGSDPFQKRVPEALSRCGMLRRVIRLGADLAILDPDTGGSLQPVKQFPQYKLANHLLWAVWRRLPGTGRLPVPAVSSGWLADRLAARYVPPSTIFQGYTANCLACLRAAKLQGAVTVVLNSTLHPRHWQREVMAECQNFGIEPKRCDSVLPTALIRRREREFQVCDKIIVLSSHAQRSFEEFGYKEKAVVVWPGVNHLFFTPPAEPPQVGLFRVCFVGRVELAKGIGYLLPAWKRLALPNSELCLIGRVYPETQALLKNCATDNVRVLGSLPPQRVAMFYRESSVLVLPSVNEGLANVILEAMASGLAVIASEKSGAEDCISEGRDGILVPARDPGALAKAILWCYHNRGELANMGKRARTKIEQQFTLSHYEERLISFLRSLAIGQCSRQP